jgi:nicotinamidase-related amidase
MPDSALPLPSHYNAETVDQVWRVPYQQRAEEAEAWARSHQIQPSASDRMRICLVGVDLQNTFCIPGFELYVGGRSGRGAVDDNRRLCKFIYRNLGNITRIIPTMDTHAIMPIFHCLHLVDEQGRHPAPFSLISHKDIREQRWRFNPALCDSLGMSEQQGQRHLLHYTRELERGGKYQLTIWPFHAMLGGIGHALVSAVEEAIFFHSVARYSQAEFHVKGDNPLTEHYSVLGPEVTSGANGENIARQDIQLIERLLAFDAVIIAGQAKSHCVAWTIDDLLQGIKVRDESLAKKIYLLEDCTSPVVIPGVIDYTDEADAAFQRFADAGMHVVNTRVPIHEWPGIAI